MADNFLAGVGAAVECAGDAGGAPAQRSFDAWKLDIKTILVDVTSFTSEGFQVMVAAVTGATLTLSGPYNQSNMPFTSGVKYSWLLYFSVESSLQITVGAFIESLSLDMKVKDACRINITTQSSGSFEISVL